MNTAPPERNDPENAVRKSASDTGNGAGRTLKSHVVLAGLASCVLFFVLDLSRGDRAVIDWIVIGLVSAAILWNVIRLAHRLYGSYGGRGAWHVTRTATFWAVGLLNTALVRPEHVHTWRPWVGWGLLGLAALDTIALFVKERRILMTSTGAETAEPVHANPGSRAGNP